MLNGLWFKKKIVQSSGCRSAPSGSIKLAKRLLSRSLVLFLRTISCDYPRFISAEWLWELVGELCTFVDVEVGEKDEGAMFRATSHGRSKENVTELTPLICSVIYVAIALLKSVIPTLIMIK